MIWFFKSDPGAPQDEDKVDALLRRGSECEPGEAEECYRQVLSLQPEHAAAGRRLAHLLALRAQGCQDRGEFEAAIEDYEESLALDQGQGRVHNNLGNVYKSLGRLEDAMAAYQAAIANDAQLAEAQLNLGSLLGQTGNIEQAILHCRTALELRPAFAEASMTLGVLLERQGDEPGAAACFRQAITAKPDNAEAHWNLALVLSRAGDVSQAIAHCRKALELRSPFAEASLTLGSLIERVGDPPGAMQCYRDAIAVKPDFAEAHFNYARQLLLLGEYVEGWKEYEWRTRLPNLEAPWPHADREHWDGSPLEGKVILLHAEQGFGDAIQFVRYALLVAERGGKVIVQCQAKLKTLLQGVQGISAVVHLGEPLPPFDVCSSLMSLPRIFETTLETIPMPVPYVRPDPEKARHWKSRLAADSASLKVGLFWATDDKSRSLTLDMLAPLGKVPGVKYFSLQQGAAAGQAIHPPSGMALVHLGAELEDFSDTAALLSNLDLLICVDTAVAHVAGAMGLPVWTLPHFPPDWRWLLGRDDSPWYPTMRLLRKGRTDNWLQVATRVGEALRQLVERRADGPELPISVSD